MEVIKAFSKTKENGGNIYKMMNAWLSNCRSSLAFMKKTPKKQSKRIQRERERERERDENACKIVEHVLKVFL